MPSEDDIYRGDLANDKLPPDIFSKVLEDGTKLNFFVKNLSKVIKVK